jgi:hypothetical protein
MALPDEGGRDKEVGGEREGKGGPWGGGGGGREVGRERGWFTTSTNAKC